MSREQPKIYSTSRFIGLLKAKELSSVAARGGVEVVGSSGKLPGGVLPMLPIEGGWGDVTATTSRAAIADGREIAAHGGLVPGNLAFFSRGGSSQVAPFYQRARRALSGLDIPSCRSCAAFSQLRSTSRRLQLWP